MLPGQSSNHEDEALRGAHNFLPVPTVYEHDKRFNNRNAEEVHYGILEAARLEHERVRNEALRIFQLTLAQEQQLRAQNEVRAEEERLQIEEMRLKIEENRVKTERKNVLAEIKRRELEEEARKIPVIPPKPPTPPAVAAPTPVAPPAQMAPSQPQSQTQPECQQPQQNNTGRGLFGTPSQQINGLGQNRPQQANSLSQPQPQTQSQPPAQDGFSSNQQPSVQPFAKPPSQQPSQSSQPSGTRQPTSSSTDHLIPGVERYVEIHQNLKKLRQYLLTEGKTNIPFKKMLGDYRRSIRQTCGQLTGERGANKACVS